MGQYSQTKAVKQIIFLGLFCCSFLSTKLFGASLSGTLDCEGRAWSYYGEAGNVTAEDGGWATITGVYPNKTFVRYQFCLPYTVSGTVTQLRVRWYGQNLACNGVNVRVYNPSTDQYFNLLMPDNSTNEGWRGWYVIPTEYLETWSDCSKVLTIEFETFGTFALWDSYHLSKIELTFSYSDPSLQKGDLDASYACSLANMQVDCFRNQINAYDMFQNGDPFSVDGKLFWSWAASVYQFAQHLQAVDVQSLTDLKDLPEGIQGLYNDIYGLGLFQAVDVASIRFWYQFFGGPEPSSMALLMSNLQTNLSKAARRAGGVSTGAGTTRESCTEELYQVFLNQQDVSYFGPPPSYDWSFSSHSNNWYLGWHSAAEHAEIQDVRDMGSKAADAGLTMKAFGDAWLNSFVNLQVTTNLSGVHIQVNDNSYTAPKAFHSIRGMSHVISALSQVTQGEYSYHFIGWSDGGAPTHTIIPTSPTNYEALYAIDIPSSPVISVTPSSRDFGSVQVGSYADLTFTVQNTGGGTLTGSATGVSSPFSIVSGSPYSLTANHSQDVTVRFSPTAAQSYSQNVTFTGGGGATRTVSGSGYNSPPLPPASINYPSSSSTGQYTVSWSSSSGAISYQLERSNNVGGSWLQIYSGPDISYPQSVVSGNYRYRVKAMNASGSSGWTTGTWDCVVLIIPGDFDGDGLENFRDYAIFASAWNSQQGQPNWNPACDISDPKDNTIDWNDLAVFAEYWLFNNTFQGNDLSALKWSADADTRVTGPDGCVYPTFVMHRPDGKYGMYFYDGDGESFGDTGYATSIDGMKWTYEGRVLTHGGNGFDNINAVITDIVSLAGGRLRAYCSGMRTNQAPVQTSIFYTETNDPCGVSWPNTRHLLFPEEESIGCPRVYGSAETGYTIYFYMGNQIIKRTSANGIDNWSEEQVVIPDFGGGFDIVGCPQGGFKMFVGSGGNIKSLYSADGSAWIWDTGSRLTPNLYNRTSLYAPVLAEINGVGKMYIGASPNRQYIYSATSKQLRDDFNGLASEPLNSTLWTPYVDTCADDWGEPGGEVYQDGNGWAKVDVASEWTGSGFYTTQTYSNTGQYHIEGRLKFTRGTNNADNVFMIIRNPDNSYRIDCPYESYEGPQVRFNIHPTHDPIMWPDQALITSVYLRIKNASGGLPSINTSNQIIWSGTNTVVMSCDYNADTGEIDFKLYNADKTSVLTECHTTIDAQTLTDIGPRFRLEMGMDGYDSCDHYWDYVEINRN